MTECRGKGTRTKGDSVRRRSIMLLDAPCSNDYVNFTYQNNQFVLSRSESIH